MPSSNNPELKGLAYARWGTEEPKCPFCQNKTFIKKYSNDKFRCTLCKKYFNHRTNTVVSHSNINDTKWIIAYTAYEQNSSLTSVELGKILNITQKSSWHMLKKIRSMKTDFPYIDNLIGSNSNCNNIREIEKHIDPIFQSNYGKLYNGDCIELFNSIKNGTIDCIFADPPFNLGKDYGSKVNDNISDEKYIKWMLKWIDLSISKLDQGGSIWLYNLPKWNMIAGAHLLKNTDLTFKHQIAISMKSSLPIPNKLYPAHYSLLYFIKGKKPKFFLRPRIPIETCRHCGGDIKDYGGHRSKIHPDGVNLSDIWTDLSPVRHKSTKYRLANALPEKLLERVLSISTNEGSLVLDPFGGSGTTYAVAERMKRRWIGFELGDCEPIIQRLQGGKSHFEMPNNGDASPIRGRKIEYSLF